MAAGKRSSGSSSKYHTRSSSSSSSLNSPSKHSSSAGHKSSSSNSSNNHNNHSNNSHNSVSNGSSKQISEKQKKLHSFYVRAIWSIVMLAAFFGILAAGHTTVMAMIGLLQIQVFREVINITSVAAKSRDLGYSKAINWYFLVCSCYYLALDNIIFYFRQYILVNPYLAPIATHHRFISYCLYIFGFVAYVTNLRPGQYRFQMMQFCVTHMTLLMVVFQAYYVYKNIFAGLFWFVMPVSLVIVNDIFAYLCGITFGKHPLIALSPKKTVEGFVGAWISTAIGSVLLCHLLIKYKYMICPVNDLKVNIFSGLDCVPDPVFVAQTYTVPFASLFGLGSTFQIAPIYLHVAVLATFASLIAPFGGFFASGLKRAFKIKDFGDTIPGHGGVTDRVDCQFLMGFFTYIYYDTFISNEHANVGAILQLVIQSLTGPELIQLTTLLHRYLVNQGLVDESVYTCLAEYMPPHDFSTFSVAA